MEAKVEKTRESSATVPAMRGGSSTLIQLKVCVPLALPVPFRSRVGGSALAEPVAHNCQDQVNRGTREEPAPQKSRFIL